MQVNWTGRGSGFSAVVGDYSLFAGWGSRRGEGWVWEIRTQGGPLLSTGSRDSLDEAKSAAAAAMYERLSDFYGAIITEETELGPHDYQSRDW